MSALDFMMTRGLQRVLAPLLMQPEQSFSLSDLIRAAGSGRGGTQKIVKTLHEAGLLTDRRAGNQRLFRIDTSHPFYPELHSLGLKTFGMAERLRGALRPVKDRIEIAFVFGSMASDSARAASDIDLLVAGDVDFFEVGTLLSGSEKELGRPIHLNLVGVDEWSQWKESPVGDAIISGPKIMVLGDQPRGADREPKAHRNAQGRSS